MDLIAALVGLGISGLVVANVLTRHRAIYCPACRTPNLVAFVRSYRYRCKQCAAEYTRIGMQFVREGAKDEETIPSATAKLKDE